MFFFGVGESSVLKAPHFKPKNLSVYKRSKTDAVQAIRVLAKWNQECKKVLRKHALHPKPRLGMASCGLAKWQHA